MNKIVDFSHGSQGSHADWVTIYVYEVSGLYELT